MNNPRQITSLRAAAVISSTIIGVGILSFPRYMTEAGNSSAPLLHSAAYCSPSSVTGCWPLSASGFRRRPCSCSAAA